MRIALLEVVNINKKYAMNKDLAGGMGTYSDFGYSLIPKLISHIKNQTIKVPLLSFAYLQAILKSKGHEVHYYEGNLLEQEYDMVLIYGSLVDFRYETKICKSIKNKYPSAKVGFFGTFPTVRPEAFSCADFVIKGEAESYFLYEFRDIHELTKTIEVKKMVDLNDLPTPDFDNFPIKSYSYFPAIKEKPFLTLQASRGCPYSCSYYCAYGMVQGAKYRTRSAENIVKDIKALIQKYKVKGIQFRDPTFGLDKGQVKELCRLIKKEKIKIRFGIETRLDILDKKTIKMGFSAGLRNINVGIETTNKKIAKINKRKLINIQHQEDIIRYCKKLGIKVSAFYIIGLPGDTKKSIKRTIKYATMLNTNVAQFAVSCPFPGTKYYDEMKSKNLITEDDFEKYNSVNLVFRHDKLSKKHLQKLLGYAYNKYYFRPAYVLEFLKWRIREFWL